MFRSMLFVLKSSALQLVVASGSIPLRAVDLFGFGGCFLFSVSDP